MKRKEINHAINVCGIIKCTMGGNLENFEKKKKNQSLNVVKNKNHAKIN